MIQIKGEKAKVSGFKEIVLLEFLTLSVFNIAIGAIQTEQRTGEAYNLNGNDVLNLLATTTKIPTQFSLNVERDDKKYISFDIESKNNNKDSEILITPTKVNLACPANFISFWAVTITQGFAEIFEIETVEEAKEFFYHSFKVINQNPESFYLKMVSMLKSHFSNAFKPSF